MRRFMHECLRGMLPAALAAALLMAIGPHARADDRDFLIKASQVSREVLHLARQLPREASASRVLKKTPSLRIGFMIGAFDPPHIGHIQVAETAIKELKLDRLVFAPTPTPLRKPHATPLEDRLEMSRLAMAGHPEVVVRPLPMIELLLEKKAILASLGARCRSREGENACYLIMGTDAFERNLGRHPALLNFALKKFQIVIVGRLGIEPPAAIDSRCLFIRSPDGIERSSTLVRKMVGEGKPLQGFVPDAVSEYISLRHLYSQDAPVSPP